MQLNCPTQAKLKVNSEQKVEVNCRGWENTELHLSSLFPMGIFGYFPVSFKLRGHGNLWENMNGRDRCTLFLVTLWQCFFCHLSLACRWSLCGFIPESAIVASNSCSKYWPTGLFCRFSRCAGDRTLPHVQRSARGTTGQTHLSRQGSPTPVPAVV